jgi:hypothetical protein
MDDDDMPSTLRDFWGLDDVRYRLTAAVRFALKRPNLDGETVESLGVFLRCVERLPEHDESVTASMTVSLDTGEGAGYWEASFNCDGLELSTTEIFRGQWGTDHETKYYLRAGYNHCSVEDDLDEWLSNFVRMVQDDYKLSAGHEPE